MKEEEFRQLCSKKSLDFGKIKLLIQLGIDVNGKDNDRRNALHLLCRFNSNEKLIDAIKLFIQLGINVNGRDIRGRNALHLLCAHNSNKKLIDAVKIFIELGIDVKTNGDNADARILLRHNIELHQKKETVDNIIQILDRAHKIQMISRENLCKIM